MIGALRKWRWGAALPKRGIGVLLLVAGALGSAGAQARNQIKREEKTKVITCRFESAASRQSAAVPLNETPRLIDSSDVIGSDHGGGDRIEARLVEKGRVVLVEIQTAAQQKGGPSNSATQFHYVDSTLLPRRIIVEGMILKGSVVVEAK